MLRKSSCSVCERNFCDGETIYNIHGELICDDCISSFQETFEDDESWVDDIVDEMRDRLHGQ